MMKRLSIVVLLALTAAPTSSGQLTYGTDVSGSFMIPVGKFSEGFKPGIGGLLGFYYDLDKSSRLSIVFGYSRWGVDSDALTKALGGNGTTERLELTGAARGIPLLLSLRMVTPGPGMRMYGMVEAGLYAYWVSVSGKLYQDGLVSDVSLDNRFRSEPGFNLGFGALFPLSDGVYLDFSARYHFVQDSQYYSFDRWATSGTLSTSQYLSFSVGASYSFAAQ